MLLFQHLKKLKWRKIQHDVEIRQIKGVRVVKQKTEGAQNMEASELKNKKVC